MLNNSISARLAPPGSSILTASGVLIDGVLVADLDLEGGRFTMRGLDDSGPACDLVEEEQSTAFLQNGVGSTIVKIVNIYHLWVYYIIVSFFLSRERMQEFGLLLYLARHTQLNLCLNLPFFYFCLTSSSCLDGMGRICSLVDAMIFSTK